ncbi:unnamed protein product [Timema podura]|uniref:Protein phosphatase n=1 Tax=Timema podura TaxID=61482 RepID=A0ABN7NWY9_TIMPD|nr:unnamed protein product [Timema podura]
MMQSIVWTGRLLSRALWNGLSNYSNCVDPNLNRRNESRIVSAVCGFPKELANAKLKRGQFGDDAWFTARYKSAEVIGKPDSCKSGLNLKEEVAVLIFIKDVCMTPMNRKKNPAPGSKSITVKGKTHISPNIQFSAMPGIKPKTLNLLSRHAIDCELLLSIVWYFELVPAGVADGVGGWRNYGIDPGEFSNFLMRTCERLVSCGRFVPTEPAGLLARSYYELLESKQPILGSSTACVMVLNAETRTAYAANIGDSGFVLVRKGEVVHRSEEQQHYFNTPFQLSLPPPGHSGLVLSDRPESADTSNFTVEDGDVILLATDGVFDNVPDHLLLSELCKVEGERDPVKLQGVANAIALMARSLAFDSTFMSPFAKNARDNGIDTLGGKPDDITVLLATVVL